MIAKHTFISSYVNKGKSANGSKKTKKKRDYDLNTNFRAYTVGDVVLKIDSAKKVGQSPKLRSQWKGPYSGRNKIPRSI